jgi:hypothetical protein
MEGQAGPGPVLQYTNVASGGKAGGVRFTRRYQDNILLNL